MMVVIFMENFTCSKMLLLMACPSHCNHFPTMPTQEHGMICISNGICTVRLLTQQKGELLVQRNTGFCDGFLLLLFTDNWNKTAQHLPTFCSQDPCVDFHATTTRFSLCRLLGVKCCTDSKPEHVCLQAQAIPFLGSLYRTCCHPFPFITPLQSFPPSLDPTAIYTVQAASPGCPNGLNWGTLTPLPLALEGKFSPQAKNIPISQHERLLTAKWPILDLA